MGTGKTKTPLMRVPLLPGKTREDAEALVKQLRTIWIAEVRMWEAWGGTNGADNGEGRAYGNWM